MGDEDRPRPMVGRKPCEKRPNAADQFEEHQVEYERRDTQTLRRDWETHNSTYPKLRDELEKRRSIAHVGFNYQSSLTTDGRSQLRAYCVSRCTIEIPTKLR
ncbi:uncharacterized protein LOC112055138 [Bicyclus anynana]|uniref:Uncharacterized protein LOC112055138 n=1 Tax=Bicyclus anynana TaxID=110368 RepID=A0A6J1NZS1_BICAN|nr:uncharacterized protein LOC112055138 [Bicyclus anynana]